jgi:hypothetical protein
VQSGRVQRRLLAFVARGAMLGVDVVHGDFEHIVAADADAVDFYGRLFAGLGGGVLGILSLLSFAHGGILPRT